MDPMDINIKSLDILASPLNLLDKNSIGAKKSFDSLVQSRRNRFTAPTEYQVSHSPTRFKYSLFLIDPP
jgi:hypothetical protein